MRKLERLNDDYTRHLETAIHQWLGSNPRQGGCLGIFGSSVPDMIHISRLSVPVGEKQYDFAKQFAEIVLPKLRSMEKTTKATYDRTIMAPLRHQNYAPVRHALPWALALMLVLAVCGASLYALIQAPRTFGNCPGLIQRTYNKTSGQYDQHTDWYPCRTLGWLGLLLPAIALLVWAVLAFGGRNALMNCAPLDGIPQALLVEQNGLQADQVNLKKLMTAMSGQDYKGTIKHQSISAMISHYESVITDHATLETKLQERQQTQAELDRISQPPSYQDAEGATESTPLRAAATLEERYDSIGASQTDLRDKISGLDEQITQLQERLQAAFDRIKAHAFPTLGDEMRPMHMV
jgi:chaperonin cofactor prefoldin